MGIEGVLNKGFVTASADTVLKLVFVQAHCGL